jgi:PiT family inorganic phosphate transporter
MRSELLLVIVVMAALLFDFTNGFHDTANVVASAISTRAISPRPAVALASILNFAGALLSLNVAATVATGIVSAGDVTETVAFAAIVGAIAWNLVTWIYGMPSSSSHALIGALIGAVAAGVGGGALARSADQGRRAGPGGTAGRVRGRGVGDHLHLSVGRPAAPGTGRP